MTAVCNIVGSLLTGEELLESLNNKHLYNGESSEVGEKLFDAPAISDDLQTLTYCGLTVHRLINPTRADTGKYGLRAPKADWFSYNGLSASEVQNACKRQNKDVKFLALSGMNIRADAPDCLFLVPYIVTD